MSTLKTASWNRRGAGLIAATGLAAFVWSAIVGSGSVVLGQNLSETSKSAETATISVKPDVASIVIDANFPGGNVVVDSISNAGLVRLRPDLRDTTTDWFYTAFRVRGAAGKTLNFVFDAPNRIGARGPAISNDGGETWRYLSKTPDFDSQRFEYRFKNDETDVLFALAPLYTRKNWTRFLDKLGARPGFEAGVLCRARNGSDVDELTVRPVAADGTVDDEEKSARFGVALTARHHCCESTASFVLEGIVEGIAADDDAGRWLREHCEFLIVPFVDQPGVEAGDQGKNRRPHDHNRDYAQAIYPSVRALKRRVLEDFVGKEFVFLDWHCPWIRGGLWNERIYAPGMDDEKMSVALKDFSVALEKEQGGKSLPYREAFNLPFGKEWNVAANYERPDGAPLLSSKHWAATVPSVLFAGGFEIPYSNASDVEVTPDNAREFGRSAARALFDYLSTK